MARIANVPLTEFVKHLVWQELNADPDDKKTWPRWRPSAPPRTKRGIEKDADLGKGQLSQIMSGELGIGHVAATKLAPILGYPSRLVLEKAAEDWWGKRGATIHQLAEDGPARDAQLQIALDFAKRMGTGAEAIKRALERNKDLIDTGKDALWWMQRFADEQQTVVKPALDESRTEKAQERAGARKKRQTEPATEATPKKRRPDLTKE